jgi:hypothetical protein
LDALFRRELNFIKVLEEGHDEVSVILLERTLLLLFFFFYLLFFIYLESFNLVRNLLQLKWIFDDLVDNLVLLGTGRVFHLYDIFADLIFLELPLGVEVTIIIFTNEKCRGAIILK